MRCCATRPAWPACSGRKNCRAQAVAADPHYAFGQVWLAVALGYQARILGPIRRRGMKDTPSPVQGGAGYGGAGRSHQSLRHFGAGRLAYRGGARRRRLPGAHRLWRAAKAEALALFDRAVKLAPDNVAVHYQIGLSLAGL